jgi:dihydrofolate reductase
MQHREPRVTIHMVASLDGFIARRDGGVDWLETSDTFEGGATLTPETVEAFLKTIDCYVMGSRTYETALDFEARVSRHIWFVGGGQYPLNACASSWLTKCAIRSCPS